MNWGFIFKSVFEIKLFEF